MPHLRRVSSDSDLRNAASQQQQVSLYDLDIIVPNADALEPQSLFTIPNHTFDGLEDLYLPNTNSIVLDNAESFPDFDEDVTDLIEPAVQVLFRDLDWDQWHNSPTSLISAVSPRAQSSLERSWYDDLEDEDDDDDALIYDLNKQYADYSDYLNGVQLYRRRAITNLPFAAQLQVTRGTAYDSGEESVAAAQTPRESVPSPLLGRMQRCPYDLREQRGAVEDQEGLLEVEEEGEEWFGDYEAMEMV